MWRKRVTEQRLSPFASAECYQLDLTCNLALSEIQDDLETHPVLLTKRTLQNLHPDERAKLWPTILRASHAVLIEGTTKALLETNKAKWKETGEENGCTPPAFNWYLTYEECVMLWERGAEFYPFMAEYYLETRARRTLRTWDSPIHKEAYKIALQDLHKGKFPGMYGPIVAIVW